ncbi:SDR family NAD(P)-dependent oxidoreductase [Bosea sp. 2RAB26]|uniref:SDR family NAD(P)-dependent oxidoreductase n=1 Tax=Bosea sp. 2RAB26 TaxID=3237476 RepID=UPI003F90DAD3
MTERLRGKVAIVAGAGSIGPGWGNGKATATIFAREGARVVCADLNRDAAEETAAIIQNEGAQAFAVQTDVTRADSIADLVGQALGRYGRIDILDNNVGIAEVGSVVDLPQETWERVFKVNVTSAFLAMKHVIPVMQRQFEETGEGGSIINISSIASIRHTGVPYASYSATKAALNHLTRTTAVQYAAQKIRVNAILPGLMKTPMVEHSAGLAQAYGEGDIAAMWKARDAQVPMGHMGEAWDVAYAALFLASDEARYVTGIELVVDGGITLKYG